MSKLIVLFVSGLTLAMVTTDLSAQTKSVEMPTMQKTLPPLDPVSNQDMEAFQKEFKQQMEDSQKKFDEFMNQGDAFPKTKKNAVDQLSSDFKTGVADHLEEWFNSRYGAGSQQMYQDETKDTIRLHVVIPGLNEGNVAISVKDNVVSIDGDVTREEDRRDFSGNVVGKSLYTSSIHKSVPLPDGVDANEITFEKNKNEIVIIIPKIVTKKVNDQVSINP